MEMHYIATKLSFFPVLHNPFLHVHSDASIQYFSEIMARNSQEMMQRKIEAFFI